MSLTLYLSLIRVSSSFNYYPFDPLPLNFYFRLKLNLTVLVMFYPQTTCRHYIIFKVNQIMGQDIFKNIHSGTWAPTDSLSVIFSNASICSHTESTFPSPLSKDSQTGMSLTKLLLLHLLCRQARYCESKCHCRSHNLRRPFKKFQFHHFTEEQINISTVKSLVKNPAVQ